MRWLNRVGLSRSVASRAGWRVSHWTKKRNRQPFRICGRNKILEISGFHNHRAMAEEYFLKPSAIVVAKNEDQGGLKL